ncbi:hypothetical protein MHBO_003148 [Bonamia ostreae]|uniref:LITAF domain-containing protein n=1 Tax=Bonamia ostreae TaxID=126728 RepID=A0ABV2APL9_9EUKA
MTLKTTKMASKKIRKNRNYRKKKLLFYRKNSKNCKQKQIIFRKERERSIVYLILACLPPFILLLIVVAFKIRVPCPNCSYSTTVVEKLQWIVANYVNDKIPT